MCDSPRCCDEIDSGDTCVSVYDQGTTLRCTSTLRAMLSANPISILYMILTPFGTAYDEQSQNEIKLAHINPEKE